MIKKKTGIEFTPQDFRYLSQCVSCGKALKIPYGTKCQECFDKHFKNCEVCEVTLRHGVGTFYTYDIKAYHRDSEDFVASKEMVREFKYEVMADPIFSETLCIKCVGWKDRIKHRCFACQTTFENTESNYKLNGNCCKKCSIQFEQKAYERIQESKNKETFDNKFIW